MERHRTARKIMFWFFFAAWLTALELPTPPVVHVFGSFWAYVMAKSLHVCAFAFLSFSSLLFPRSSKGKLAALASVSFLAFISEAMQYLLRDWCYRTGTWLDVAWDHLGIAFGAGFWMLLQRCEWGRRITS